MRQTTMRSGAENIHKGTNKDDIEWTTVFTLA